VIQYNKRDLDDCSSMEDLRGELNLHGVPEFEASAITGEGVLETFRAVIRNVSDDLQRRL
jgi:signal recognition particle receptor subunit beta